jgi:hypothetical protein
MSRRPRLTFVLAAGCALLPCGATAQDLSGDPESIPRLCRVAELDARPLVPSTLAPATPWQVASGLPAGTRGWECIPGAIRNDGVESFRIEVDVNGPMQRVWMDNFAGNLVLPGPSPLDLKDDGLGQDQSAGDFVFTAGPFRYNTGWVFPSSYQNDAASPAGIYVESVGFLHVQESDGTTTRFLVFPSIGLVRSDVAVAPVVATPAADVAYTAHLINVKTTTRTSQSFMRSLGGDPSAVTTKLYAALPDVFDFLVLCSTDKVERTPYNASQNFVAGIHLQVSNNFTGSTWGIFNNAPFYGSAGKLGSVNALDAYDRGFLGNVVTHEITHQWASYTNTSIGLSDGTGHYDDTSAASLVGGFVWNDDLDGTFTRDCNEGRNGGHHAPPLDLYFMGLIDGSAVPTFYHSQMPAFSCTDPITAYYSRTIADVQAAHGVRTPGPATSQKTFAIGFVAETHGRFLNATERTFLELLAAHYTKTLAPSDPDPYMGFNWPPVTRYFGHGTTWRSDVQALVTGVSEPAMGRSSLRLAIGPNPAAGMTRLEWAGLPGRQARVEILDLHGRRLRLVAEGGVTSAIWDGRDDGGRRLPAGVYLARVESGEAAISRKLIWLP